MVRGCLKSGISVKGAGVLLMRKVIKNFEKKKKALNNRNGEAKAALRKILEPDS